MVHVRVHYIQSFIAPDAILYSSHIFGEIRDGIFKLLRSPGIDSKESIPPVYVARALNCKRLSRPEIDSKESIPPGWESIPGF